MSSSPGKVSPIRFLLSLLSLLLTGALLRCTLRRAREADFCVTVVNEHGELTEQPRYVTVERGGALAIAATERKTVVLEWME